MNNRKIKCIRCGIELDFWNHYPVQVCDKCDKELNENIKRITELLEEWTYKQDKCKTESEDKE